MPSPLHLRKRLFARMMSGGSEGYNDDALTMNPYLMAEATSVAEAARLGMKLDLRAGVAERMEVPDAGADWVICTRVLCSVANQTATLREIMRVLRPGGRFVFIEHVAAQSGALRIVQNMFVPAWRTIGDGCHPNRETWTALLAAGFTQLDIEHYRIDVPIFSPHIAGIGVK